MHSLLVKVYADIAGFINWTARRSMRGDQGIRGWIEIGDHEFERIA
jgi:hypothetical protein